MPPAHVQSAVLAWRHDNNNPDPDPQGSRLLLPQSQRPRAGPRGHAGEGGLPAAGTSSSSPRLAWRRRSGSLSRSHVLQAWRRRRRRRPAAAAHRREAEVPEESRDSPPTQQGRQPSRPTCRPPPPPPPPYLAALRGSIGQTQPPPPAPHS